MNLSDASPSNPHISFTGDVTSHPYAQSILNAFNKSLKSHTKLSRRIIKMEGMSGKKYRYMINNLINEISNPRYLEIGSWKGSTACSAMYKNKGKVLCIDNWTGFGGPKLEFLANINSCISKSKDIEFSHLANNCEDVDFEKIGKFNVYFYDGAHDEESQKSAIIMAQKALEDEFILVIDDWNHPHPRNGTISAINDLNLKVLFSLEIRTTGDNSYPAEPDGSHPLSPLHLQNSDWHNGYFIAVMGK